MPPRGPAPRCDERSRSSQRHDSINSEGPTIIVLHTIRDRADSGNPYSILLRESMPAGVTALEFHLKIARKGQYDVIHAHNVAPHEWSERKVLRFLHTSTGNWTTLNPTPVSLPGGRVVQITHGHHRDWFGDDVKPEMVVGTLLSFGLILPCERVGSLIDVFLKVADSNTLLRIVGVLSDPELRDIFVSLRESEPAVSAELEYATGGQLVHELGRAELVALPHNSDAALLALSLRLPVLTPRRTSSEHLQRMFDSEWVLLWVPLRGLHTAALRCARLVGCGPV